MTTSGASSKAEKVKVTILLHALGEEALKVYNTLDIDCGEDGEEKVEHTCSFQSLLPAQEKYYV